MKLSKPEEIEGETPEEPRTEETVYVIDPVLGEEVPAGEALQRLFEHWQLSWDAVEEMRERVVELEEQVRELGGEIEERDPVEGGVYDPVEDLENGE